MSDDFDFTTLELMCRRDLPGTLRLLADHLQQVKTTVSSSDNHPTQKKERLIRWEEARRTQFGYLLNILLVLATSSLGFAITLLQSTSFRMKYSVILFWWTGVIFLILAIGTAILCAFIRLLDFRGTADRVRSDTEPKKPSKNDLRRLGSYAWAMLYATAIFFIVGVCTVAASVILNRFG